MAEKTTKVARKEINRIYFEEYSRKEWERIHVMKEKGRDGREQKEGNVKEEMLEIDRRKENCQTRRKEKIRKKKNCANERKTFFLAPY